MSKEIRHLLTLLNKARGHMEGQSDPAGKTLAGEIKEAVNDALRQRPFLQVEVTQTPGDPPVDHVHCFWCQKTETMGPFVDVNAWTNHHFQKNHQTEPIPFGDVPKQEKPASRLDWGNDLGASSR